jgi:hypothetical protein
MMSLIADLLMIIVVSASILYAINKKPENKAIDTDGNKDHDDDDDTEKEEENEFISEWISAIKEIIEYGNKINRRTGCIIGKLCSHKNPKVLDLIKVYPDKISWSSITYNREPWAIKLLTDNIDKIYWDRLCGLGDEFSINLIINNKEKIIWKDLCRNKNPKVIPLLKERIEYENNHNINRTNTSYYDSSNKIDWNALQQNPNAKELIMNRINDEFSGRIEFGPLYIQVNNILPILLETIKNKDIESVKIFKKLIIRDISNNSNGISFDWSTILNTLFNDE